MNHTYFSGNSSEIFYWAGVMASDGCVGCWKNNTSFAYRVSLLFAKNDIDHLKAFRHAIGSTHKINLQSVTDKIRNTTHQMCALLFNSKIMFDDLKFFNIIPRKSLVLEFPKHLICHENISHFLRGAADGDGCFRVQHGNVCFNMVGSFDFLTHYATILNRECDINRPNKNLPKMQNIHALNYGGNKICPKIFNYLYKDATIYLQRKFDIVKPYLSLEVLASIKPLPIIPDLPSDTNGSKLTSKDEPPLILP